jgi:hypothetical protein
MLSVLVAVQIIAGQAPEVVLMPTSVETPEQCEALAAELNAQPPSKFTDDKGRPIMIQKYSCLMLHSSHIDQAQKILDAQK